VPFHREQADGEADPKSQNPPCALTSPGYNSPVITLALLARAIAEPVPDLDPDTILGDWPDYVDPIGPYDYDRYTDDPIVDAIGADLVVRAWRWSDAVGGIVETENQLRSDNTALILVHPWGIDDGQGWAWPQAYEAYGYVFEGLYDDNQLYLQQVDEIARPLVDGLRGRLPVILYALPGVADSLRTRRYRSFDTLPSAGERAVAQGEIEATLAALTGNAWPSAIPVVAGLDPAPDDLVNYDDEGLQTLVDNLRALGVEHVLLGGWATDMCVVTTTAGYAQLATAFDVFLVGDATLAAWPLTAAPPNGYVPRSTLDALFDAASLDGVAVTQVSWLDALDRDPAGAPDWRGEEGSWTALYDHWQARPATDAADRDGLRAPDWASAGAPTVVGATFDADAIALEGAADGRVNVVRLPEGTPLSLTLQEEAPTSTLEVQLVVRWAPDLEGQELQATLATEAGETSLSLVSEHDEGEGWRSSTWTGSVAGAAETRLSLAFSAGEGRIDLLAVDGHPGEEEVGVDSGMGSGDLDSAEPTADSDPTPEGAAEGDTGGSVATTTRPCGCAAVGGTASPFAVLGLLLAWRRRGRSRVG
jgi:hypothetical protein